VQLSDRYRPVVAVDVDGVLRLRRGKAARPDPPGAFVAQVTVFRYAYPRVFHSPPTWNDDGMSTGRHMFSGVGATWLRSLLDRDVEVVWATTWQHYANEYFAPLLGIPPLPVAVRGTRSASGGSRVTLDDIITFLDGFPPEHTDPLVIALIKSLD